MSKVVEDVPLCWRWRCLARWSKRPVRAAEVAGASPGPGSLLGTRARREGSAHDVATLQFGEEEVGAGGVARDEDEVVPPRRCGCSRRD